MTNPLFFVALLAEGVDRIACWSIVWSSVSVALLAEGVDRNNSAEAAKSRAWVALLAEGVDRNRETATAKATEAGGRPPRGGRG